MNSNLSVPKNISDYIRDCPKKIQPTLNKMRAAIKKAAPGAEEKISYMMPTFALEKNLVHFACFKNHIGFYPGPQAVVVFKNDLLKYKTSKGAIQFPIEEPIPITLIKKIVKFRVKQVLALRKTNHKNLSRN